MKRLLFIALLLIGGCVAAQDTLQMQVQVRDTLVDGGVGEWLPVHDTIYLMRTDTLTVYRTDSVYILRTDTVTVRVADTAALSALREKEKFYREILSSNGVDKEKLEAERNYYIHLVDSLRAVVRIAEEKNVASVNKKKKVRPIQGVAMRFYRTPDWEIRLKGSDTPGMYDKYISNRNAGNVEFDYVTGASVMLWDMTRYFNQNHTLGNDSTRRAIRRFDQEFSYDLGFYVGFGGSNLFKNFYVGLSFRFVDFFYLTTGVNVAEYQVLVDGYKSGDVIGTSLSIDDVTAKAWLVKPFIALSIDLDFLSLIKK